LHYFVYHISEVTANPKSLPNSPPPSNIEEFRPEDELDAGFLNEEATAMRKAKSTKSKSHTSSAKVEQVHSESSDESDR